MTLLNFPLQVLSWRGVNLRGFAGAVLAGSCLGWGLGGGVAVPAAAQEFIQPDAEALVPATNVVANPVAGGLDSAAQALRSGRARDAISLYQQMINVPDEGQRAQARYGLAYAFSQVGDDQQALQVLESTPADESAVGQAIGALRGELVLQLAEKAWWGIPANSMAANSVGTVTTANAGGVARWLAQYDRLTVQPNPERAARLRVYATGAGLTAADLAENQVSEREGPLVVGVLLPLSGPLSGVAQEILQGLQLGLASRAVQGGDQLVLKPIDTAALGADKAAQAALDAGARVVLGPLRASEVPAVSGVLKAANVPVLTFSSDTGATGNGVWSVAYTPAAQADAAARYAVAQAAAGGRSLRVAGLVPDNTYGREAWEAFSSTVTQLGGQVINVAFFNPQAGDLSGSVRALAGNAAVASASRKGGSLQAKQEASLPFNALFLPAPANSLPLAAAQLAYYGITPQRVQVLGTALWQDPLLLSAKGAPLRGSLFAAPAQAPAFQGEYQAAYGQKPSAMSSALVLAGADAGRLLADVTYLFKRTREPVSDLLLRPAGFPGYGGYLRLGAGGKGARDQAVVRLDTTTFSVVQPGMTLAPLPLPGDLRPATQGRGRRW